MSTRPRRRAPRAPRGARRRGGDSRGWRSAARLFLGPPARRGGVEPEATAGGIGAFVCWARESFAELDRAFLVHLLVTLVTRGIGAHGVGREKVSRSSTARFSSTCSSRARLSRIGRSEIDARNARAGVSAAAARFVRARRVARARRAVEVRPLARGDDDSGIDSCPASVSESLAAAYDLAVRRALEDPFVAYENTSGIVNLAECAAGDGWAPDGNDETPPDMTRDEIVHVTVDELSRVFGPDSGVFAEPALGPGPDEPGSDARASAGFVRARLTLFPNPGLGGRG